MLHHKRLAALIILGWSGCAAAAGAQIIPSVAYPAPRAFPGFIHPDIDQCQTINPGRRECTVPANVAGHYLIDAVGLFTSAGPKPTVAMNVIVGDQVCIFQTGGGFNGRGHMHLICETTLATDGPIKIAVDVAAKDATLDPGGPQLKITAQPWDGVISVRGADGGAVPAPSAKPTAKPSAGGARPPAR